MVQVRGTTIFMREFKAGTFLDLAAAQRMTYTLLMPAMYNLCLLEKRFDASELDCWRVGGYGGAPMPPATISQLAAKLPWLRLVNAYGATETTSPTTLMPLGQGISHASTVGAPVPTVDLAIMDEHGKEVPIGESGEVWIRGGNVFSGYWEDESTTKACMSGGFWKSGDIGVLTEDGFLKLLDRKKDMINRGGYKVFSAEVEAVLMEHDAVVEAAVFPISDPVLGEKSHAVVRTMRKRLDAGELRRFCADRLSDYKVPDVVTIVDNPLPRNAAGKVLKKELMSMIARPGN